MTTEMEVPGGQGGRLVVETLTSADPASIAAGAVGDVDITVSGLVATDVVMAVVPKALATGLVLVESVAGAGKVTVTLLNPTAGAIDDAASDYVVSTIRQ